MQKLADFIWLNGEVIPFEESRVHILNHSLHYGSGVFEGIRCYETDKGPAVFRLNDHIKRLFRSADVMQMDLRRSLPADLESREKRERDSSTRSSEKSLGMTEAGGNDGWSEAEIVEATLEIVRKNNLAECYIRPLVFYGSKMGLDPAGSEINIMIAAWPWGKYLSKEAVKVKISDFTRIIPNPAL